jgi:hypothetical protein
MAAVMLSGAQQFAMAAPIGRPFNADQASAIVSLLRRSFEPSGGGRDMRSGIGFLAVRHGFAKKHVNKWLEGLNVLAIDRLDFFVWSHQIGTITTV